jgi:hypothetical protein
MKNTFMKVGGVSSLQLGVVDRVADHLQNARSDEPVHQKGWEATGSVTASAGASGATAGGGKGSSAMEDADTYTLTKTGLDVGIAGGAQKFWKDTDLN